MSRILSKYRQLMLLRNLIPADKLANYLTNPYINMEEPGRNAPVIFHIFLEEKMRADSEVDQLSKGKGVHRISIDE